jgi:hypothetical protein
MKSRCILFIFAAIALAGCCASGNGCYAPVPGVPLASDGLGPVQPGTDRDWETRPRKIARTNREIIIGPLDGVATKPSPRPEGKEDWAQQEAADRADDERLTKKLMICRNCQPAPTRDDAIDRSTR